MWGLDRPSDTWEQIAIRLTSFACCDTFSMLQAA
jgi:hypothetical protein